MEALGWMALGAFIVAVCRLVMRMSKASYHCPDVTYTAPPSAESVVVIAVGTGGLDGVGEGSAGSGGSA